MTALLECKACPFCGGTQVEIRQLEQQSRWITAYAAHAYWIKCLACGASSGCRRNKGDAVTQWNKRETSKASARILCESGVITNAGRSKK